jgi:protein gp37
MGASTKIEWTNATWSPVRARRWGSPEGAPDRGVMDGTRLGWHCEKVSAGCANCYAETMNKRLGTGLEFKPGNRDEVELFLDEKMLLAPLSWRKPRMIFVMSMSDLFADFVPDEWIDRMFAVMALCPQHTFQCLTKRPARVRDFLMKPVQGPWAGRMTRILDDGSEIDATDAWRRLEGAICDLFSNAPAHALNAASKWQDDHYPHGDGFLRKWPLPNVWLGTSCEDQATADARIPDLLATPAAVRFVSCEPMLGPINLERARMTTPCGYYCSENVGHVDHRHLDWVICGGESGHGARPMHPGWARSLRDQCAAADAPFFFKQQGEWASYTPTAGGDLGGLSRAGRVTIVHAEHHTDAELCRRSFYKGDIHMIRVGKKRAGRLLDGIEHNGMPANEIQG